MTELSFVPRWARESEPAEDQVRLTDSFAHDLLASPYVPTSKLARSSQEPDARDLTEPSLPSHGMHPSRDIGQQSVRPQGEIVDLERLETALRCLQRETAAARLRPPPLLEPERTAPPPARAPRYARRWLLAALLAAAAVPLVYYLSADSLVSASTRVAPSPLVTLQQRFDAVQPIGQGQTAPIGSPERAPAMPITPAISRAQADIPRAVPTPAVETVALPTPQPAGEEAPRSDAPVRALDREEIALLVTQGDQLMSAGDIAAARTVFQRASDAGDVAASVALAASYDPTALKRLGVVGKHADLEKARSLYEKAERLGSAEAARRLHLLARR